MQNIIRCDWVTSDPLYIKYHDEEWGIPVHDDQKLFEFIVLESAQAGLSWLTILKKRENFKEAFGNFNIERVAKFDERKINSLLNNPKIIRNRLKIESTVNNARCVLALQEQFGSLSNYFWRFVEGKPIVNHWKTIKEVPAKTLLSEQMAKDLKSRGFKFMGPTVCYAHMQATGLVNDHITSCFRHQK